MSISSRPIPRRRSRFYLPPTGLARSAHLRPEAVVAAYGLIAASGALAYTLAIARRAGLLADNAGLATVVGLVALTLMPGRTFDERDFFALVLLLPSVALAAARAAPGRVNAVDAAVTAVGLAFAVAIKPPYAAIPALLFLHIAFRLGLPNALKKCPEFYLAAAFFALVAAVSWFAFPEYFRDVLPTISLAYVPVRETAATLIANAGVVVFLALGALTALVRGSRATAPLPASFALAALGALIAYFVQGKGWLYHVYPALALIALAYAAASDNRPRDDALSALAALTAAAPLIGALLFDWPPLPTATVAALVAWLFISRRAGHETRESLARLAGGALIGAGCGLYCGAFSGASPAFIDALTRIAPHPRLASISEGLGVGFPLVRNVEGEWALRAESMLMTSGARRLIDQHRGDASLAERLQPIIAAERDAVAADIVAGRPDALLISRSAPRFYAWAMSDPALAAARAPYRFVMSNPDPQWPIDLYVREDLIRLRGAL